MDVSGDDSDGYSQSSTSEYQQESFATYRDKVVQLAIEIGLDPPHQIHGIKGGSFNRVIGIEAARNTGKNENIVNAGGLDYIFRVPRWPLTLSESEVIPNQVAVLRFLEHRLPVPRVVAYDCGLDNAIASQFVLQNHIQGNMIGSVLEKLTHLELKQLAVEMAGLTAKINTISLPRYGRLVEARFQPMLKQLPNEMHGNLPSTDIAVLPFEGMEEAESTLATSSSFASLLHCLCNHQEGIAQRDLGSVHTIALMWRRLQVVIEQMLRCQVLRDHHHEGDKATLWHWDLSKSNMIVEKVNNLWKVTGVLDWDEALSVPAIVGRQPLSWLWMPHVRIDAADLHDYCNLTDEQLEIKKAFDNEMITKCPSFMDDAYGRGRWLRRIFTFILRGFCYSEDYKRYEEFIVEWEEYWTSWAIEDPPA